MVGRIDDPLWGTDATYSGSLFFLPDQASPCSTYSKRGLEGVELGRVGWSNREFVDGWFSILIIFVVID